MSVKAIEAEVYIQSGVEAEVEIGREIVKTVYEEPVLEPLSVTANGTYEPEEGVDGYSDVTVNVPGKIPVLEQLRVIANGEYYPEEGVDGFDEVVVNVPNAPEKMVASGSFIATAKSTGAVIDTKNTDWTKLIIVPHSFPYSVATPRSIAVKYIDMSYGETGMGITAFASNSGATINAGGWHNVNVDNGSIFVENGVVTIATGGNQASVGLFIKDVQYDWYAWNQDALEPQETNVFEGEFEATETGVLTIDTGYEGDGCPRIITIYADGQIQSDEFLENELSYSMNVYSCVKRSPGATSYPTSNALNSQCYTFYVYKNGENAYSISYSTTVLVLSRTDPEYGSSKILRFNNARTMKVWCASELSDTATFFAVGVKYKYRIVYG